MTTERTSLKGRHPDPRDLLAHWAELNGNPGIPRSDELYELFAARCRRRARCGTRPVILVTTVGDSWVGTRRDAELIYEASKSFLNGRRAEGGGVVPHRDPSFPPAWES